MIEVKIGEETYKVLDATKIPVVFPTLVQCSFDRVNSENLTEIREEKIYTQVAMLAATQLNFPSRSSIQRAVNLLTEPYSLSCTKEALPRKYPDVFCFGLFIAYSEQFDCVYLCAYLINCPEDFMFLRDFQYLEGIVFDWVFNRNG